MNTTNILAVADAIEQHSIPWLGFNMNYVIKPSIHTFDGWDGPETIHRRDNSGHDCGTVACIAGWTLAVFTNVLENEERRMSDMFQARNILELDQITACALFEPYQLAPLDAVPQAQAVRTLRHLAATGTVDWTV